MRGLCSFFIIVVSFFCVPRAAGAVSLRDFTPEQMAETVLDKASRNQDYSAKLMFDSYLQDAQNPHDRVEFLRLIVKDSSWSSLDLNTRLHFLKTFLEQGPLTGKLERELMFLIARLESFEGMLYLSHYMKMKDHPTFFDDSYLPSILPFWRKWVWQHTEQGQLLLGDGVVQMEELHQLRASSSLRVLECESKLNGPSVR